MKTSIDAATAFLPQGSTAENVLTRRESLKIYILSVVLFIMAIFCTAFNFGCADKSEPEKDVPPAPQGTGSAPATLSEKVQHQISVQVIGDIPDAGRFKEVKTRGILRVALPPAEPPFQSVMPEFNQPVGFNVALAGAIAGVLEVKQNVTILRPEDVSKLNSDRRTADYYDIVFRNPGMSVCQPGHSIPFFFRGQNQGWLTMCVGGDDENLFNAVNNAMSYFTEAGVFSSIYTDNFE